MIPLHLRERMEDDPYYKVCARAHEGNCQGRVQWHHAIIYARKQLQEIWAIVPACEYHHVGKGKNDQAFRCIALARATPEDLAKYPKRNWQIEINYCKTL